jgi:hypothetical protein
MLDILGTVSSEWRKIGNLTGQSRALDGYERKYMMSDYECISKVFSVWFDTDGTPQPPNHLARTVRSLVQSWTSWNCKQDS